MEKLLSPDPTRIGQPAGSAAHPDAVPESKAAGSPPALVAALAQIVGPDNVLSRLSDLVRYATDGGPYRCVPQVVVRPRDAADLAELMRFARNHKRHLVFRAAGTSLNGQAMTDDILVDTKTHFHGMEIRDQGRRIWTKPGVILGDAQAILARHGYMIGPDPGSTSVCTIGGVLADNSGGMRCSLPRDSYHTLEDATFVLPSGTIVDTTRADIEEYLAATEPQLISGIIDLRDRIRADTELVEFLREKFSIRNTNGIRLDAFLDEDTPARILMRLMVSSEGIFGAITESVIRTIELPKVKAVAWVMLADLKEAATYVHALMETGAEACELLVAPVLKKSVGNFPAAPQEWADIDNSAAALLLEVGGSDTAALDAAMERVRGVLEGANLIAPLKFETDEAGIRGAWHIRNGLFGITGQDRPAGSALITEDVCFPPAKVGQGASDLLDLLKKYGYPEMVMGHAAFGNLHFFMTPRFDRQEEKDKYGRFLDDMAELVIDKYHGSLKAEHGTGTNMAPFLEREWGTQAWELMWEVKNLIDPWGILAPDVKLTRSRTVHMENFKSYPAIEEEINLCVECGFCEPICPSRHATVTPRQRIVLRREMARQPEGSTVLRTLQEQYQYDAVDMCAADGTCAVACPVSIDTGKVMKSFRAKENTEQARNMALKTAQQWKAMEKAARASLTLAQKVPTPALAGLAGIGRVVINPDLLPTVPGKMPKPAERTLPQTRREGAQAVYFPACINRIFGASPTAPADRLNLPQAVVELGRRAGTPVWIPNDVAGDCCGTPFSSKGYQEGFAYKAREIAKDIVRWTEGGKLPIIIDAASCTHGVIDSIPQVLDGELAQAFAQVRILDAVEWLRDEVIEHLPITHHFDRVAVHPNCSTLHLGIADDLVALVQRVATEVVRPQHDTCCGAAGDRGLLHPELMESATREERQQLTGHFDAFVSDNRTCEMGLEMTTGNSYESILTLLERASRPVVSP